VTEEFPGLVRWLRAEGLELLPSSDAVLLVDDGEARFRIDRLPDGWTVSKSLRGAPMSLQLSSNRAEDIDRYLVMVYLRSPREPRGLGGERRLVERGADGTPIPAGGWSLAPDASGGVVLTAADGHRVWFAHDIAAAAFSRYAQYSADDLRALNSGSHEAMSGGTD